MQHQQVLVYVTIIYIFNLLWLIQSFIISNYIFFDFVLEILQQHFELVLWDSVLLFFLLLIKPSLLWHLRTRWSWRSFFFFLSILRSLINLFIFDVENRRLHFLIFSIFDCLGVILTNVQLYNRPHKESFYLNNIIVIAFISHLEFQIYILV